MFIAVIALIVTFTAEFTKPPPVLEQQMGLQYNRGITGFSK